MLCINNFNYSVQVLGQSDSGISDLYIYDTCGQILRLVKSISSCLYFKCRFHYYKYMLTNKILVLRDFFVPCSYICNLSPFANFPSCIYYSNYSSYPWSSLCISPISFISAFLYFAVLFFLERTSTTIPAIIAIVTTTMTAIIPAFRPCIENSGGFSST